MHKVSFVVNGHALILEGVCLTRLDHVSATSGKLHNMSIKMSEVARPLPHPGLPKREDFLPIQIIVLAAEERAIRPFCIIFADDGF